MLLLVALWGMGLGQDSELHWLVGVWGQRGAEGRLTLERWASEPDGSLTGAGEERSHDVVISWEKTRITLDRGKAVFHAAPGGGAETDFTEVARDAHSITFENAAHDYPQRIRYWREGPRLMAEISRVDGGKKRRWAYCPIDSSLRIEPACAALPK